MVGTNEQVNRLSTGLAQGVAQEAITFVFRRGYTSMIGRRSRGVHCTIFWWIVGRFNDASLWQRFIANVGHPSCKRTIKDLESLFTSCDAVCSGTWDTWRSGRGAAGGDRSTDVKDIRTRVSFRLKITYERKGELRSRYPVHLAGREISQHGE